MILTDLNNNNQTDFVLSGRAFKSMAQKGLDQHILKLGIVDVEYKRWGYERARKKKLKYLNYFK